MAAYNNDDIIRYVEEEMLPEERQRFEAALAEDMMLSAAVSEYRKVKYTLAQRLQPDPRADQLRMELRRQGATHFKQPGKLVTMKKYLAGIAAAAAILIGVLVVRQNRQPDYEATYGNVEMQVSVERGDNRDSLLQAAALYFNERAYTKVVPILDTYLQTDSTSQMALYYRGLAGLQAGNVPRGLADLEKVYAGTSVFKYDAAFYTALYYAQQHNKKNALDWLHKIPADAAIAAKAAALEKDLK